MWAEVRWVGNEERQYEGIYICQVYNATLDSWAFYSIVGIKLQIKISMKVFEMLAVEAGSKA